MSRDNEGTSVPLSRKVELSRSLGNPTSKLTIKFQYSSDFKRCFVPGCDDDTETALNQIDASFQQYALPKGKVIYSKYSKQLGGGAFKKNPVHLNV